MRKKNKNFYKDLCKALLLANISLNKLSNNKFKHFLEKYTNEDIPSETTLRKRYVEDIYQETILKIRVIVNGKRIWVSIDEIMDASRHFIVNCIIGILEVDKAGQIFLLYSEELDKTNIQQYLNYLIRLWGYCTLKEFNMTMFYYL